MKLIAAWLFAFSLSGLLARETEPKSLQRTVAIENVCAWPNLTLLPDGTIIAILFDPLGHGTLQGDVDCYASSDGLKWEKRSTVTQHEPDTIRMNHDGGLAKNGDLLVLCSGWTNLKQPIRPEQERFSDAVLRSWVLRSKDAGRTWSKSDVFPATESDAWSEHIPFGDIWTAQDGTLRTSCYQGQLTDPTKSSKTKGWRSWCFRSDDDGATWGAPLKVTARNEINGHLTRLADKRLLLSYGVRIAGQHGVCAKISGDDGKTWSAPIRLARSEVSDCRYPATVQLANGKLVTAYYSKAAPECDHYHMGVAVWDAPEP
jgi:Neuraminidase (sialidase)